MNGSRRRFLAAGAGALGASAAAMARGQDKKMMVGACGLSCDACPLKKAGKCKGCASGKEASAKMLKMKPCPVLQCAAKKGIDYCGTGCKKYADCKKLIGRPYAQSFMDTMKKRMSS
ncbi:MAG: DUF3795 domain-containing protein [Planctomycetota bacterium]